jgi:hypothetical protein
MRTLKLVAPALAALGFAFTAVAQADFLKIPLIDFFGSLAPSPNGPVINFCVVADLLSTGDECMILADGVPVTSLTLLPGPNFFTLPATGAMTYTATGPEILERNTHPDNPGIN